MMGADPAYGDGRGECQTDPVSGEFRNKLLAERTRLLAARPDARRDQGATTEMLALRLGKESWCLRLVRAGAAFRPATITPVPGAAADIAGLAMHRGSLFTLIDLSVLLGCERPAVAPSYTLAVELRGMSPPVALLVEKAEGVIAADLEKLGLIERQAPGEAFARGLAHGGWIVLDDEVLLTTLRTRAPAQSAF